MARGLSQSVCGYCGIDDPNCIAQCNACKRYFCNGRGRNNASHIFSHIVASKHEGVTLHKDSSLGPTPLQCHHCGCCNVFLLEFTSTEVKSNIVVFCTESCGAENNLNCTLEERKSLIKDRSFAESLIKVPKIEQPRIRQITAVQIKQLEELWKDNKYATFEDLQSILVKEPHETLLWYKSASHYRSIFGQLLWLEEEQRIVNEPELVHNVKVLWEASSEKIKCFLTFPHTVDMKITLYDELRLSYLGKLHKPWSGYGNVIKVPDNSNETIGIEMRSNHRVPLQCSSNFAVEFSWRSATFIRMRTALKKFATEKAFASSYIFNLILGYEKFILPKKNPISRNLSAPNLPELNLSQSMAVEYAIQRPISLIQGPPGTGKSVTSAAIVYHLVKQNNGPVLVCAPSNTAVDHFTEKVHQTGLKVVRVCAKRREEADSSVSFLYLNNQIKETSEGDSKIQSLKQLEHNFGKLSSTDANHLQLIEKELLQSADVICCTCVGAGDSRLANLQFHSILIDESVQATEPECIIPIVLGAMWENDAFKLILVGDHCQLGPTVMCKKAAKAGLSHSLFERFLKLGIQPIRLKTQYRMHPQISEFPNGLFYDGFLQNGVSAKDRKMEGVDFPWPQQHKPMFFYSCYGHEEVSGTGTSYLNRNEADIVEQLATTFLNCNVKPHQIGIITPYAAQRSFLVEYMSQNGSLAAEYYKEIEVNSIDAFQGREKDIVIISCVRSNENRGIGFLKDSRRLNVALTRARYGIIIIGNPKTLARDKLWNNLLTYYKKNKVLVEGPLKNWKESRIRLKKDKKPTNNFNHVQFNQMCFF